MKRNDHVNVIIETLFTALQLSLHWELRLVLQKLKKLNNLKVIEF